MKASGLIEAGASWNPFLLEGTISISQRPQTQEVPKPGGISDGYVVSPVCVKWYV